MSTTGTLLTEKTFDPFVMPLVSSALPRVTDVTVRSAAITMPGAAGLIGTITLYVARAGDVTAGDTTPAGDTMPTGGSTAAAAGEPIPGEPGTQPAAFASPTQPLPQYGLFVMSNTGLLKPLEWHIVHIPGGHGWGAGASVAGLSVSGGCATAVGVVGCGAPPGGVPPFQPTAFAFFAHVPPQNGWPTLTGLLRQNAHVPWGEEGVAGAAGNGAGAGVTMPAAFALVPHPLPQYGCPCDTGFWPQKPHMPGGGPATVTAVMGCPRFGGVPSFHPAALASWPQRLPQYGEPGYTAFWKPLEWHKGQCPNGAGVGIGGWYVGGTGMPGGGVPGCTTTACVTGAACANPPPPPPP